VSAAASAAIEYFALPMVEDDFFSTTIRDSSMPLASNHFRPASASVTPFLAAPPLTSTFAAGYFWRALTTSLSRRSNLVLMVPDDVSAEPSTTKT
jgi:hypothetical protein